MPAPIYRWFYRAHGVQGLARSILAFAGISPVRKTLIGMVASILLVGLYPRILTNVIESGVAPIAASVAAAASFDDGCARTPVGLRTPCRNSDVGGNWIPPRRWSGC